jgi:pimeloyl-ACP methyl ester carboxylesterase
MPAVFVHGNPETAAIWDELIPHLGRADVVTLSPPGFGARVPDGFGATADEYRDGLADALAKINGPIDLVGHDWGAGHTMRIAMERPDLIRSWAADALGIFDPDYVWHDLAQVWQTPGRGEQAVAQSVATPAEARAKRFESYGIGKAIATKLGPTFDEEMGRCVLALYRSAAQPALVNWGKRLADAAVRPGLVMIATEDHFVGGEAMQRRSAARCNANIAMLEGLGHWWMCQGPKRGAAALTGFWSGLA